MSTRRAPSRTINYAIMIPASRPPPLGPGYHLTMAYFSNITPYQKELIKKEYKELVKANVIPDAHGRYMLPWTRYSKWGGNSILLDGPIAVFKEKVTNFFSAKYGHHLDLNRRQAHIDVGGAARPELYPSFNLLQIL